jgi:hypothetical protein
MFDPGELTVKQVRARLCELDMDGLEEVLQAEIDGKHRSSLIAEVGKVIDMVKTAEESEAEESVEEPVVTVEPAPVISITEQEWFRFPRHVRSDWKRQANGTYAKHGG